MVSELGCLPRAALPELLCWTDAEEAGERGAVRLVLGCANASGSAEGGIAVAASSLAFLTVSAAICASAAAAAEPDEALAEPVPVRQHCDQDVRAKAEPVPVNGAA